MNRKSSQQKIILASLACLVLMIVVDYLTGHEVAISMAYLLPVALCAWYLNITAVWLMALAAGLARGVMGSVEGHVYSHSIFHYWNSFTCFVIALTIGLVLHQLRRTLEQQKHVNDDLRRALHELNASTEEIRKLQNGLQVVCAWTKQIKVGDRWMAPDEFLSSQLHLTLSHGMSPEAYEKVQAELRSLPRS